MKYVSVRFKGGNTDYTYKCLFDNVKKDDTVVVDSPYDGLVTATVITVSDVPKVRAVKYIVCVVDTTKYVELLVREKEIKDIEDALEAKLKNANVILKYEMLKSIDPEAGELIKQLQNLMKGV